MVWIQPLLLFLAASLTSTRSMNHLRRGGRGPEVAQHLYHRASMALRVTAVLGFAGTLFLLPWHEQVQAVSVFQAAPGLADLVIVSPFLAAAVLVFAGTYPIDRALHQQILQSRAWEGAPHRTVWTFAQYLLFNVRHHLLVVLVPMTIILVAFDLARTNETWLAQTLRVSWAAEAVPALAAGLVFVVAPVMLRYIWPTAVLPDGHLRQSLQRICQRVGLRYRDILVWQSGGMMVNAAVMGLFPRVRYVLLSDGLLETMAPEQIEAVFGHEVGHIRHRHIQFFLLFAVCSMLLLSAVVEGLRVGVERDLFHISVLTIEAIGMAFILLVWMVAFGWISRRFERQADLFGARCVTPQERSDCREPCSIHDEHRRGSAPAVCATAARVFASALDHVAFLNGIPHDERSWRHSSIGSRIRFLTSLAGDPARLRSFERRIRHIKTALLVLAVAGLIIAALYVRQHPLYGIGVGVEPEPTDVPGQVTNPLERAD